MPRTWILTGGAGFIGANTAHELARRNIHSVVLDDLSRPSAPLNLAWLQETVPGHLTFVEGDVRDRETVEALFRTHRDAEAVVHLAGQVAVTSSVADPRTDFDVNAVGTFNVLDAARRHTPTAAFLYASTNKVYGEMRERPLAETETRYVDVEQPGGIDEREPLAPASPYGCSKAAGDGYVLDYARTYGLPALSLRQSCIYGPRQFGIEDQGWVAWFAVAAALGRGLTIFGTGKQVRDLLHVDDLVELYVRAAERAPELAGRAYNVGGGPANALSLLELVERLEQRAGKTVELTFEPARAADQRLFVCDVSRARADLGWQPRIGLDEGLSQLFSWVEGHTGVASRLLPAV